MTAAALTGKIGLVTALMRANLLWMRKVIRRASALSEAAGLGGQMSTVVAFAQLKAHGVILCGN
ncbi:hypothetical protein Brsp01_42390 [Brucella sp. NBRC 12950]|jgi:hypothetical protein|nr:hypothetical protein Brsp01_42390 [Brucella sp. NBRC 12950]